MNKAINALGTALLLLTLLSAQEDLPVLAAGVRAPQDSLFHQPLARGITLVYQDKFQQSISLFDSLEKIFPEHPAPNFYKAAAYQTWMSSYRINFFQKDLEEQVQLAIDKGDRMLQAKQDDPWLHFYIGAAYGYRAFFKLRSYNFIGAYRDGTRGIDHFKLSLAKDPSLYDVYLGLGSYHYWRTARSKFIRIIAFWMRDKRDLGIEQMRFSIDHGRYCPPEATLVLVTALYDYGKIDEALGELEEFMRLSSYQLISSLYLHGRLLIAKERWAEVDGTYRAILQRLEAQEQPSIGYQVECGYWIAKAQQALGHNAAALESAGSALELNKKRDKEKELEGQFDSYSDILNRLEALQTKLKAAGSH